MRKSRNEDCISTGDCVQIRRGGSGIAADQEQKDDKDAPKEKDICRNEMVTGSLIAKRSIRKTQAEWEQLARETKESMDAYTSRENGTVAVTLGPAPFQH